MINFLVGAFLADARFANPPFPDNSPRVRTAFHHALITRHPRATIRARMSETDPLIR
jgi:hypothetical protein